MPTQLDIHFFYYCALSIHQKTHNTYKPYFAITQQSLHTMSTSIGDALLFCTQLLGVALKQENLSIGIRKINFPYSNTKVLTKIFEL